jgi:type II secretory pathway pseudopilin PulG
MTYLPSRLLRTRQKAAGFTLVEVGIAAVLMAMLVSGVLLLASDYLHGQVAASQGQALATMNTAVNAYEQKYTQNLVNGTAIPVPGYANVANIYAPTPTELFHLGFLSNATPDVIYGTKIGSTLINGEPAGLVWLTTQFTNVQGFPDQSLAGMAMQAAGGDAGMSTLSNTAQVVGADGWTATNPVPGKPAILAMRNGAGSGAYVRLDGSTPMQGSLNINGFNVTNASNVNAANLSASGAVSAPTVNATNVSATGLVYAQGGLSTGGNVSASGSMTASGNITAGGALFTGTSAIYSDGWNTIVRNAGGALYVYGNDGNLKPTVTAQVVTPAGNGVQVGGSYYYGDGTNSAIRQNGTLYVQNQAGTGAANVDLNYLHVAGYANVGWGCAPNGMQAQDGSGAPLFCINGVWQQVSGRPNIVTRVGGTDSGLSVASCAGNEVMTGGMCYNTDSCGGNDSSAFGGYPSGNSMYCPRTSASFGCDHLTAYVFCAQ